MTRASGSLAFVYSGGPTNETPLASLGGQASTADGKYVACQTFTSSTIPGVDILYAARNTVGSGVLSYVAATNRIQWTANGGSTYSFAVQATGVYGIGSSTAGMLRLWVNTAMLPVTDTQQNITIGSIINTLFGEHPASASTLGITEYRCVYLVNESARPMRSITMDISDTAPFSTLYLGSPLDALSVYNTPASMASGFMMCNPFTGFPAFSADGDILNKRERLQFTHLSGLPYFPFYPTDDVQNSDGISEDIAPTIVDRFDSTNVLAKVDWLSRLQWPLIQPGRMVSFWVKKVTTPYLTATDTEVAHLDLTFTST